MSVCPSASRIRGGRECQGIPTRALVANAIGQEPCTHSLRTLRRRYSKHRNRMNVSEVPKRQPTPYLFPRAYMPLSPSLSLSALVWHSTCIDIPPPPSPIIIKSVGSRQSGNVPIKIFCWELVGRRREWMAAADSSFLSFPINSRRR